MRTISGRTDSGTFRAYTPFNKMDVMNMRECRQCLDAARSKSRNVQNINGHDRARTRIKEFASVRVAQSECKWNNMPCLEDETNRANIFSHTVELTNVHEHSGRSEKNSRIMEWNRKSNRSFAKRRYLADWKWQKV